MDGLRITRNCAMVIFGASGDLTQRKLIPALYNLAVDKLLPEGFAVIGFARKPKSDASFRAEMKEAVAQFSRSKPLNEAVWARFEQQLHYHQGNYDDPASYAALDARLNDIDAAHASAGNRLYYLSTPPEAYKGIVAQLGAAAAARMQPAESWTRVIIEKPFGRDTESARDLNTHVHHFFREEQIYRIDHYLGKETVQNILVFRFANGMFEPIWDRRYIDHVQITVSEAIGIENRGSYYETSGVVRDIIQNHLLQVLALVAMEPPAEFNADAVRNEKLKVLKALKLDASGEAGGQVRGQYGPGKVKDGVVNGYVQETGVNADSTTETYLAMKLLVDNWRWAGVPFYVRSGKRLARRVTEIAIQFRMPPLNLFGARAAASVEPNVLVLTIQPDEAIALKIGAKRPGNGEAVQPVVMDFKYSEGFNVPAPDAYERLILDAVLGDSTLFTRADEVEAAWQLITPIIEGWAKNGGDFIEQYRAGSNGPKNSDDMLAADGRKWRSL